MITEYELYSDERYQNSHHLLLGGVICTQQRRKALQQALNKVRESFGLMREMRWAKVSSRYLDAYKTWVDVFFDDPYARFLLLKVDRKDPEWRTFSPRAARKPTLDDQLAFVFYQFLLLSFYPLRDTKRWWVYPDSGFFSKDKVLNRVEFLFNRTYKSAFGPKTSRVIRLTRTRDSKSEDLIQLVDVLLGAISCDVTGNFPTGTARAALVEHCHNRWKGKPITQRGFEKILVKTWQRPDKFTYSQ